MQIVPFAGWSRNARLVHDGLEMIVTLEVGPRVLFWGKAGGDNMLVVHEADAGTLGGHKFKSYGGHRLWIAPEIALRTFQPDNDAVLASMDDETAVFTSPPDKFFMQKEMRITPISSGFSVLHRVYNHSPYDAEMALWTPTQCAGGEVIFPLPEFAPHHEVVLPALPLVHWTYTKMSDPRWTWGDHVVRLAFDPAQGPQKVGALVKEGVAVCSNLGQVFLKRFGYDPSKTYPDYNCNFEMFTNQSILEIESLGPVVAVESQGFADHEERWYLFDGVPPLGDQDCANWLRNLARTYK